MKVREFIETLNPKKVLEGKIIFKVIKTSGCGDKWFFYCDQNENPAQTVDEFCSHDGIRGCMDLEIVDYGMGVECRPDYDGDGTVRYRMDCMEKEELEKFENQD